MEREQVVFRCFCNVQVTKYLSERSMQTFSCSAEADRVLEIIFHSWLQLLNAGIPSHLCWDDEMLFFHKYEVAF